MMAKLFLIGAPLVSATLSWVKGGDMCAAIHDVCSSQDECTTVAYGPCLGNATEATDFLSTKVTALAYVSDDKAYLSCADPSTCPDLQLIDPVGNGYRDFDDKDEYAYVMSGSIVGDLDTMGGYVGTASYLAKQDVSTNTNSFYVAVESGQSPVERDGSLFGAPSGPYDVCISDVSGGTCGAARKFTTGAFKFSLFGYTAGDDFKTPEGMGYLAIRTELTAHGFTPTSVKTNGEPLGSADVTTMTITTALSDIELKIDFPLKYNYGDISSAEVGTTLVGAGTKNVKIKVSKATPKSIYIDYLFDVTELGVARKYFVYDPTVTVGDKINTSDATSLSLGLVSIAMTALAVMLA